MGVEKKVYSFRFNEDMVDQLKVCAKEENRTLSNLVETILLNYLRDKDQARRTSEPDPDQTEE